MYDVFEVVGGGGMKKYWIYYISSQGFFSTLRQVFSPDFIYFMYFVETKMLTIFKLSTHKNRNKSQPQYTSVASLEETGDKVLKETST